MQKSFIVDPTNLVQARGKLVLHKERDRDGGKKVWALPHDRKVVGSIQMLTILWHQSSQINDFCISAVLQLLINDR